MSKILPFLIFSACIILTSCISERDHKYAIWSGKSQPFIDSETCCETLTPSCATCQGGSDASVSPAEKEYRAFHNIKAEVPVKARQSMACLNQDPSDSSLHHISARFGCAYSHDFYEMIANKDDIDASPRPIIFDSRSLAVVVNQNSKH